MEKAALSHATRGRVITSTISSDTVRLSNLLTFCPPQPAAEAGGRVELSASLSSELCREQRAEVEKRKRASEQNGRARKHATCAKLAIPHLLSSFVLLIT